MIVYFVISRMRLLPLFFFILSFVGFVTLVPLYSPVTVAVVAASAVAVVHRCRRIIVVVVIIVVSMVER